MTDALAAIRAEKAFLKLLPADGEQVLAAFCPKPHATLRLNARMIVTATAIYTHPQSRRAEGPSPPHSSRYSTTLSAGSTPSIGSPTITAATSLPPSPN